MAQYLRVAAYVKLAKLWERRRESAIAYHWQYYREKFADDPNLKLVDLYIDITGRKEIAHRPEMLRLLRDCTLGKIDCIATQPQAYLAANTQEFCYLIKFVFCMTPEIEIITEDENYSFDTLINIDQQRQALLKMANDYVGLKPTAYEAWKSAIVDGMNKLLD